MSCRENRAVWRSRWEHSSAFSSKRERRYLCSERTRGPRLRGSREVSGTLRRRKYRHRVHSARFRLAVAVSLVRQEEEGLVLDDWTAQCSAEKILMELRCGLLEEVVRV